MSVSMVVAGPAEAAASRDIWRDTWVRYLGYANEVGESFKALIPRAAYLGSYAVSSAYVCADAVDKGRKAYQANASEDAAVQRKRAAIAVLDTGLWQAFASVMIPGLTINRICAATAWTLTRTAPAMPLNARKAATTAAGLCAIPLIIHPIDHAVDVAMDKSFRAWVQ